LNQTISAVTTSDAGAGVGYTGIRIRGSDATRINPFFCLSKPQRLELVALTWEGRALRMIGPVADHSAMRSQMPPFDQSDRRLLEDVTYRGLSVEISDWLRVEYADRFRDLDTKPVADHIVDTGRRLGLKLKEEFAFLGQMMATSGAWFIQNGYPTALYALLQADPATRLCALVDNYATEQAKTPQAEIMERWADVQTHLAAIPLVDCVTPQQFLTFCQRFLSKTAPDVAPAIAETRNRLSALNLVNQNNEGKAMILTLIYGPRFFEDPFYPWAQLPAVSAIDAAWAMIVG
jgi:hypothetical protein